MYRDVGPLLDAPALHKQVFGIRRVNDGEGLGQMRNSLNAYEIARNEGPGTLHALGVLYGTSVALAFGDEMWRRYRIAEALERRGDGLSLDGAQANPFARDGDASIAALVARGSLFFVCNNALMGFAKSLVAGLGLVHEPIERVSSALRGALLPGATLVPAGVAALNDAQERKYTYVAV